MFFLELKDQIIFNFKYKTALVERDASLLQKQLSRIIKYNAPALIKKNTGLLLIVANILIVLTGIGLLAIGAHALYSNQTVGRCLPLFFKPTPEDEWFYEFN